MIRHCLLIVSFNSILDLHVSRGDAGTGPSTSFNSILDLRLIYITPKPALEAVLSILF